MIDAGKAYVTANKQFVSGVRELAQQSREDEVIEVRSIISDLDWSKAVSIEKYCNSSYTHSTASLFPPPLEVNKCNFSCY